MNSLEISFIGGITQALDYFSLAVRVLWRHDGGAGYLTAVLQRHPKEVETTQRGKVDLHLLSTQTLREEGGSETRLQHLSLGSRQ